MSGAAAGGRWLHRTCLTRENRTHTKQHYKGGFMESTSTKRTSVICGQFTKELEAEARATRECLEQVPMDKADWKPHEKSMPLGYLAILVADIPRWLQHMIEHGVVDFQTYEQRHPKTADELVALFDENMEAARKLLSTLSDDDLAKEFQLKNGDQ